MKWHLEEWVKAYVKKTPEWLSMPVSARGLGRELLTYCDENGAIVLGGEEPGVAIAYMLGARPKEHKRIGEDVAELLRTRYLVREGDAVVIRNFAAAQDRTPGAKRTAEWRARKEAEHAARHAVTPPAITKASPGDVTCDARETSHVHHANRHTETVSYARSDLGSETIRSEREISSRPGPAPSPPPKSPPTKPPSSKPKAPAHPRFAEVVAAYHESFEKARGAKPVFDAKDGGHVNALLRRLDGNADKAIASIRAAYADPWKARNATIATIAADPSKYLGSGAPERVNGHPVQPPSPYSKTIVLGKDHDPQRGEGPGLFDDA